MTERRAADPPGAPPPPPPPAGAPPAGGGFRPDATYTMGVLALVFGALAVFFGGFFFGVAAIVLGAMAGRRGNQMGWWGVGLGALAVVLRMAGCGVAALTACLAL